jgi:hypothetical protein
MAPSMVTNVEAQDERPKRVTHNRIRAIMVAGQSPGQSQLRLYQPTTPAPKHHTPVHASTSVLLDVSKTVHRLMIRSPSNDAAVARLTPKSRRGAPERERSPGWSTITMPTADHDEDEAEPQMAT